MLVKEFIDEKAKQLVFYLELYWQDKVAFKEMDAFIWDVLEEWNLIKNTDCQIYTHKERVFWHIIYQVQYVGGHSLRFDESVREEMEIFNLYLKNERPCPLDVVGMRPH
uniref:hypothetical protein n=1 Tax=Ningiella ruwaisensis TaxID=2364274 RepID=UPI00109EF619|nr:hypothetical protein [Ningiella ruwaisensis]